MNGELVVTLNELEALEARVLNAGRELLGAMHEQLADEIAGEHGGFRPRFFETDAEILTSGDVAKRSALQIDQQVTPIVAIFGWHPAIGWDEARWYAPMPPREPTVARRRGRKPAQQPILRWRAMDPGLLELTGFDGAVELIACRQQLLMRLLEFGARRTGMGNDKTREIATLGLSMIRCVATGETSMAIAE
ncbi:hypothetical protein B0G80_4393 [Paraburkholderia sp. BL6669N2]|uniref:hypothetical protein n=1 Tax=Paraburkholderia sp. BL6669N2 TaxID=1938807 RepID=UPI000E23EE14|nr:hypothetical protein [Paraburkholderia sp. BL6669N2]REG61540.1 hypothetical protein B0G80_4393 [Paraburkholderia sp. BL6669N2]